MRKILFILFIFSYMLSFSTIFNSVSNGNWTNENTWDGSGVPQKSDVIFIKHDITLDRELGGSNSFSGELEVEENKSLTTTTYNITIKTGGKLIVNGLLEVYDLEFSNGSYIIISETGEVKVFNDFTNKNNSTEIIFNGSVVVDGVFFNGVGGVIDGSGTIQASSYIGDGITFNNITDSIVDGEVLPVDMLYMSGHIENSKVYLKWATMTEINNNHFIIEKSKDIETWGYVNNIIGNNNSNNEIIYNYIDIYEKDYIYYRITQYDNDGGSDVFPPFIVTNTIRHNDGWGISTIPNPFDEVVVIKFEDGDNKSNVCIKIYNMNNVRVYYAELIRYSNILSIDLSFLSDGFYIINIKDGNDTSQVKKIMKN